MPPHWRTRVLAAGLLAVVAAELAIAAVTALTSGISRAAAVGRFTVTNGAMGLGFAVSGALLAWHRQGNPVGWLFLAAALAEAMSAAAIQVTGFGAERGWGRGVLSLLASLFTFGWPLAIGLCLPVALLLFPSGRPASTCWRWLIWAAASEGMLFTLSFAAPGAMTFGRRQVAPELMVPSYHHLAPLWTADNLGFPVILALAIVSLAVRYRCGGDAERRQLLWLVLACLVVFVYAGLWWGARRYRADSGPARDLADPGRGDRGDPALPVA